MTARCYHRPLSASTTVAHGSAAIAVHAPAGLPPNTKDVGPELEGRATRLAERRHGAR